jgi:hypothetical protein
MITAQVLDPRVDPEPRSPTLLTIVRDGDDRPAFDPAPRPDALRAFERAPARRLGAGFLGVIYRLVEVRHVPRPVVGR